VPFASLLACSSLLLAILIVAGFSYRWTYYYNFGLKDLAGQVSGQSIAIASLELIRTPRTAAISLGTIALPLMLLKAALVLCEKVRPRLPLRVRQALTTMGDTALLVDVLTALVLFYSAYWAGSKAGYAKFEMQVSERPDNTLPVVTIALTDSGAAQPQAIGCAPEDWNAKGAVSKPGPPPIVGSAENLRALREGFACNVRAQRTWRLLYRDEKFIYVFATGIAQTRPLTLIIPNSERYLVVLGGSK
jgi:hypothetical protein